MIILSTLLVGIVAAIVIVLVDPNSGEKVRKYLDFAAQGGSALLIAVIIIFCLACLVKLALPPKARQERPEFLLRIIDDKLHTSSVGLFGSSTQLNTTELNQVRHIHWYVSAFSRVGTVRVTLWDKLSPNLELVGIDIISTDGAKVIGEFRAPDLILQSDQHQKFIAHFLPRLAAGEVTSTVDIESLNPIAHNGHAAPGWILMGDTLIFDPKIAKAADPLP